MAARRTRRSGRAAAARGPASSRSRSAPGPDRDRARSLALPRRAFSAALRRRSPRCRTRRSTTAIRAATTSCAPSWPRTWSASAASPPRPNVVVTGGYTQGCGSPAGRSRTAARARRRRGSVARRLVGDDPLGRARRRRVPVDGDGARVEARLDADAFLVTPRTSSRPARCCRRSAAGDCSPGRRTAAATCSRTTTTRVRLRQPAGAHARLAPERVSTSERRPDARAALRLGWMVAPAELVDAIAAERWAVDRWPGDLGARVRPPARDRRGRPPPAPHPARVSRPPRRLAARLAERLPDCRVEGDSGGLHLLLRLPAGTDEDAVVSALERRRIRIRASPATG